jgi:hypothetical protein
MDLRKNLGLAVLSLAGLPGCLVAQATAEHATISGGAATAAQSTSRALGGALKNLGGTLDTAGKKTDPAISHAGSTVARSQVAVSALPKQQSGAPSQAAKIYEDPAGIKPGMTYDELLQRFGEPSMKVTNGGAEQTFYYYRQDGQTQVRVSAGHVLAVDGGDTRPEAAVVEQE